MLPETSEPDACLEIMPKLYPEMMAVSISAMTAPFIASLRSCGGRSSCAQFYAFQLFKVFWRRLRCGE